MFYVSDTLFPTPLVLPGTPYPSAMVLELAPGPATAASVPPSGRPQTAAGLCVAGGGRGRRKPMAGTRDDPQNHMKQNIHKKQCGAQHNPNKTHVGFRQTLNKKQAGPNKNTFLV